MNEIAGKLHKLVYLKKKIKMYNVLVKCRLLFPDERP